MGMIASKVQLDTHRAYQAPKPSFAPNRFSLLQRTCACGGTPGPGGECAACTAKRLGLQRRSAQLAPATSGEAAAPIVHEVLRSPGQPLDPATRAFMEPRFGHDFSQVRVHTDARAADSARAVNALAYTVGRHIVLGGGKYAPETRRGRQLLAHEIAHTVQQDAVDRSFPPSQLRIAGATDPSEREAEEAAVATMRGHSRDLTPGKIVAVARQPTAPTPIHPAAATRGSPALEATTEEGLIALSNVLRAAGRDIGMLRAIYHQGEARIEVEIQTMRSAGAADSVIAPRAAAMREALAEQVRETGGALLRKGAELFDAVRGNVGRPNYEALRAAGRTDAEIIYSAAHRTNELVNRLPTGLRWTGRGLWVVTAGISVYIVLSAPAERQVQVAEQEAGGLAGGAAGTGAAEGICVAAGIATEGIGLIVCGVLGGLLGYEVGHRAGPGLLERAGQLQLACLRTCETLPWYAKGLCMMSCSPSPM